jgi:HAD superfamily hydrolase (TIGR01509 family)
LPPPPLDLTRYAGVVFDMDGVLLDSEPLHYGVAARVLAAEGYTLDDELYRTFTGRTAEAMWEDLHLRFSLPKPREAYLDAYDVGVLAALAEPLTPAPGARELVHRLVERGMPIALASSSQRVWIQATLRGLGLDGVFPVIVSGQDVVRGKPAPDIYLLAAAGLGQPPERCVAIEDAPAGVASARAAGMDVVAVRTHLQEGYPFAEATVVVDSLEELLPGLGTKR